MHLKKKFFSVCLCILGLILWENGQVRTGTVFFLLGLAGEYFYDIRPAFLAAWEERQERKSM